MKKHNRTIQFIPSVREGNGIGHLRRCLEMAEVINDATRFDGVISASLLFEPGTGKTAPTLSAVDSILDTFSTVPVNFEAAGSASGLTVIDRRESTSAYVESLRMSTTVVGLDEGGPGRGYCDYLIDTLPSPRRRSPPNLSMPPSSSPRSRRTEPVTAFDSIIVTFGGEDPAGLTPLVCTTLIEKVNIAAAAITAVRGPSAPEWLLPEGITLLHKPALLRELLNGYDLVITSFGLTAYEALASGVAVLLVNPTRYHEKLSRAQGFPTAGIRRAHANRLRRVIDDPRGYSREMEQLEANLVRAGWNPDGDVLGATVDALASLRSDSPVKCPVCGGLPGPAAARFHDRTYLRCSCSDLIFLNRFDRETTAYDEAYFFDEYKAQYGKTYLEDFRNIQELAGSRLKIIAKLSGGRGDLLDAGCAYGPFLAAAAEIGFNCHGIDIASSAVEYVNATLDLPAVVSDFIAFDPAEHFDALRFDCLTMWYVIEHFRDLSAALSLAAKLVKPGGVFAFSTPNAAGISGRRSLRKFLEESPRDHFTVWSPRSARTVLNRFGFSVRKIRVTGHHPERFPGVFGKLGGLGSRLCIAVSRLFRLGDTFEVYAVRRRGTKSE
jgi:2-polyprenyl-3-methyl-5-hydroxy-6-metoxy-1,4-benzoquinol methylase